MNNTWRVLFIINENLSRQSNTVDVPMRKKELLATHALLHEVGEFVNTVEQDIEFPEYDAVPIGPKSVHEQKGQHQEAVFALLDDITTQIESTPTQDEPEKEDAPLPA